MNADVFQLRISYTDLMQTNEVRQAELKRNYYFECGCAVCNDSGRVSDLLSFILLSDLNFAALSIDQGLSLRELRY